MNELNSQLIEITFDGVKKKKTQSQTENVPQARFFAENTIGAMKTLVVINSKQSTQRATDISVTEMLQTKYFENLKNRRFPIKITLGNF